GRRYCETCKIVSLYKDGSSLYAPHRSPVDTPQRAVEREDARRRNGHKAYFQLGPEGDALRINPNRLLRDRDHFRRVYAYLERNRHDSVYQQKYGLKERPIFMDVKPFCPPWSISIDIMHLLSNCAKALLKHYRGDFGLPDVAAPGPNGEINQDNPDIFDPLNPPLDENGDPLDELGVDNDVEEDDLDDEDNHILDKGVWPHIARQQEASRRRIPPTAVGNIVPITKTNRYKTIDWYTWVLHQSPIFLQDLLPDVHFRGYILFVRAFQATLKKSYSNDEMDELENLWLQFSEYYETQLYKLRYKRLHYCLPIFHQILHIAEYTRRLGPMYAQSQFPMERVIRVLKAMLKSMSDPNQNMTNRMSDNEMNNLLSFLAPLPIGTTRRTFHALLESDRFSDSERKFDIGKFFAFAMKDDIGLNRPGDREAENPVGEWANFDVDEPWIPDGFEYAPFRGRPLPRADGEEEDDDVIAEMEDELEMGDVSIVDKNIALTDMMDDEKYPLSDREKDHIISHFRARDILPNYLYNADVTVQQLRDFVDSLKPTKFKTLVMAVKESAISDPIAYTVERVKCSQFKDKRAFYSYAHVQYTFRDLRGRTSTRYGEVLFFICMKQPQRPEVETIELAYMRKMPHRLSENTLFVELVPQKKSPGVELVTIRQIDNIVGVLTNDDVDYIVWRDGCLAEPGRF
ncbi:hypothetical protein BJ508DRAFT_335347, partial [Ascobolus immersus RN42]